MAPMTRCFAKPDGIITQEMADYYARRANCGLIITEGTIISEGATGYRNVPGIYSSKHAKSWQQATNKVHQQNGKIFCQLWHVGRVSHPIFLNGALPVSASATQMKTVVKREKNLFYGRCRALELIEIKRLIDQFYQAAIFAKEAGFDGIEIHGANGYLIDQFLHLDTNHRQDQYGGSPDTRIQFALDIIEACQSVFKENVGLRLSPGAYLNEMIGHPEDAITFKLLLNKLKDKQQLCYIHTGSFDDSLTYPELNELTMTQFIRQHYQGNLIACGGYSYQSAEHAIKNKQFDLVAMGRPFIANPDLINKLVSNEAIKSYNPEMLTTLF